MQSVPSNSEYTFDASAKEITLIDPFDVVTEEQVLKITNLTTNAIIYDSNRRTHPITMTGAVITHTYDNTGMQDTDLLRIRLDTGATGL